MYSAAIDIVTDGTHLVIPGIPGRKIRVVNYCFTSDGTANTVQFFSNLTALTGVMHVVKGVPIALAAGQLFPSGALMLFQGAVGESINIVTSANGGIIGGHLTYILAD